MLEVFFKFDIFVFFGLGMCYFMSERLGKSWNFESDFCGNYEYVLCCYRQFYDYYKKSNILVFNFLQVWRYGFYGVC